MLKAGTAARRRTLQWGEPQAPDAIREQIVMLLTDISTSLQTFTPQWIGHIKVMVTSGAEATYGSLTSATDRPQWAGALASTVTHAEMTVYAAIYSTTDQQVAQAVDNALADVRR